MRVSSPFPALEQRPAEQHPAEQHRANVTEAPIMLVRRPERTDPVGYRRVRRALESGEWVRIAPGVLAPRPALRALLPIEKHRVLVLEMLRRARGPVTLGMHAAAAIWGIEVLGACPSRVDVLVPRATGGRSSGLVRRYGSEDVTGVVPLQGHEAHGHRITTPARTALDLARVMPFAEGVAVIDQLLASRRTNGPLATRPDLDALVATCEGHRARRPVVERPRRWSVAPWWSDRGDRPCALHLLASAPSIDVADAK